MDVLTIYLIFAVTTSLSSIYELFWPALKAARDLGIQNELTQAPYLSTFIFFCINVIVAPLVFLVIVIPGMHQKAYAGISKVTHEN